MMAAMVVAVAIATLTECLLAQLDGYSVAWSVRWSMGMFCEPSELWSGELLQQPPPPYHPRNPLQIVATTAAAKRTSRISADILKNN